MPAYHFPRISPEARTAALRALDDALSAPTGRSPPVAPLTPVQLLEIDIIDDAIDHHLANKLPR
jgi:hypothetical protein